MIDIILNGKDETVAAGTVGELLAGKGLDATRVVVERNGEIVKRDTFATTALASGDRLEVLRFVGGG